MRQRAEIIFDLLDPFKEEEISLLEIEWMLKSAAIFKKSADEVKKKSQLILTAAGAKGTSDRIKKQGKQIFSHFVHKFTSTQTQHI